MCVSVLRVPFHLACHQTVETVRTVETVPTHLTLSSHTKHRPLGEIPWTGVGWVHIGGMGRGRNKVFYCLALNSEEEIRFSIV